ncbi:outer membrane protein assembly factor BamE [Campylobacter peloridis]|uniref:outer membrane protein assembly factor BamE n=1 Tax=Campylobacter peloridis TaxID=488546 RepID=UPI001C7348B6|nr:outer membrane protein assembly factor BamE [Campylobacter peloridis]MBX1886785.1 outer membrane protein assembly factor BamE [Campylobacter peloridis]
MRKVSLLFAIALSFTACNKTLYNPQVDEKITVAKAQKDIKIGMSSSEIIEIMGSPNIISTDEQRREVWVYDKVSSQRAYQNASGGISIILAGAGGNSGSSVSSQRTLTVIIKFDDKQKVRDIAYHTSSF